MGRYAVEANRTLSTNTTVGSIVADGTRPRRGKLYELVVGQAEAAPADGNTKWEVGRITAAGTSTAVTPRPLDPADAATEADAGEAHSVEPTYTAGETLLGFGLNQRATMRWVAAPGGELVYPATAAAGLGIRTPVAAGVAGTAHFHFEEQ